MSEFRELQPDELEPLATGAWILGAGGGGSPYLGYLNMRKLYSDGHRVQIIQPEELADDDLVAVVSNMGAPLVGQERPKFRRQAGTDDGRLSRPQIPSGYVC